MEKQYLSRIDCPSYLPLACLQRAGESLLAREKNSSKELTIVDMEEEGWAAPLLSLFCVLAS